MKLLTPRTPAHVVHTMRVRGAPTLSQPSGIDDCGTCVAKGRARRDRLASRLNAEG